VGSARGYNPLSIAVLKQSQYKSLKNMGKRYIVGDIHGDYSKLNRLIDRIAEKIEPQHDKIIFLGDYVSYGSDSFKVIDFLIALSQNISTVFLLGDHDHAFINFLGQPDANMTYLNLKGGTSTVESYRNKFGSFRVPAEHIQFLEQLELTYEENDFFCVHAGINPKSRNIRQQKVEDLLTIGEEFYLSDRVWKKLIIFGHTPVENLHSDKFVPYFNRRKNVLGLNTLCGHGGRLTCYESLHQQFYQVQ